MPPLTVAQSQIVLGSAALLFGVNAIAGRYLLKHVERMETDYNNMHELGNKVLRIARYQEKIIVERVVQFDSFDEIAYEEMTRELQETIKKIEDLEKRRKPKHKK